MAAFKSSSSDFGSDESAIGKVAENEGERRRVLKYHMDNTWADLEIGRLDRIETRQRSGWLAYEYQSGD